MCRLQNYMQNKNIQFVLKLKFKNEKTHSHENVKQ